MHIFEYRIKMYMLAVNLYIFQNLRTWVEIKLFAKPLKFSPTVRSIVDGVAKAILLLCDSSTRALHVTSEGENNHK